MNRRSRLSDLTDFPRLLPRWNHAAVFVLLTAVVVRGAAMLALGGSLQADPDAYAVLAENLAQHRVLGYVSENQQGEIVTRPSAYRPPLYPVLLRLTCVDYRGRLRAWRVGLLHVALGAATTLIVWRLALRCGLGSWAVLAAAATLFDPLLLNQAALVMTETLAAALVAASLWFLDRRREGLARWDVAAGLALGLAALCRPSFLPWIALLIGLELAWNLYHDRVDRLGRAATVAIFVALTLSPWILRNATQLDHATPTTTHGGYTLLLGNNPEFYEHLREAPWRSVWDSKALDDERLEWLREHDMDEAAADRDAYRRAWQTIRSQPGTFLYSCLVRLGRFWSPLPHRLGEESLGRKTLRWATSAWYDAVLVLALVGLSVVARRRLSGPWLAGFTLLVSLTLVHTLFWSNMRMRAPLTPFLSLLVAAGAALIFSREDELAAVDAEQLRRAGADGEQAE